MLHICPAMASLINELLGFHTVLHFNAKIYVSLIAKQIHRIYAWYICINFINQSLSLSLLIGTYLDVLASFTSKWKDPVCTRLLSLLCSRVPWKRENCKHGGLFPTKLGLLSNETMFILVVWLWAKTELCGSHQWLLQKDRRENCRKQRRQFEFRHLAIFEGRRCIMRTRKQWRIASDKFFNH